MREAASLRCNEGGAGGASVDGVTHPPGQRAVDGVGASKTDRGKRVEAAMKQPVSVTCDGARPATAWPTMLGSETSMAWARARRIGERGWRAPMKQPVSVTCVGARPATASPTMQGSEAGFDGVGASDGRQLRRR
jgi:hypothetical protein